LIFGGIICQGVQLAASIRERAVGKERTGDPWDGRTLEWATASPPPPFNFAVLPDVRGEEPYWGMKLKARQLHHLSIDEPRYEPIEMPRNSATGFVCAFFATVTGFALIWHIWWLVALGMAGAYATLVVFAWRDITETMMPAAEVAGIDRANRTARSQALEEKTL
jgi:cytochrome o ubiquinol oxidase subunit 1